MTKTCKFCQIISDEPAASLVLDDESCVAFLDHRPLFPGHCLLVPRTHYETLMDLPGTLTGPFFSCAKILCRAVEESMAAEGTFVAINNKISQSVPHLHVHVVPRKKGDGLRGFFWPRQRYADQAEMHEVAERIRAAVALFRPNTG
ncbi:MAG: HIT family protein [Syntrophobacteraceae bacterium]